MSDIDNTREDDVPLDTPSTDTLNRCASAEPRPVLRGSRDGSSPASVWSEHSVWVAP